MGVIDIEYLRQWIGKAEAATDHISQVPIQALQATLNREEIVSRHGDYLPPMWHILFFLPIIKQSDLSPNGHPHMGGFMPPVPLARRMYAGGRMLFHQPLYVGDQITRNSTIKDVNFKQGRTGPLVFLKINHEISSNKVAAITEEQDIVYRQESRPGDPLPSYQTAPRDAEWRLEMTTDPVMLFRFSALTFNGHRIHYDFPYATSVEGYPGLVVHGPLLAILLLELLHQQVPQAQLQEYRFQVLKPVFAAEPFFLCGAPEDNRRVINLWISDADNHLCLQASARLA